jgi:hypothetical protein
MNAGEQLEIKKQLPMTTTRWQRGIQNSAVRGKPTPWLFSPKFGNPRNFLGGGPD